MKLKLNVLAEKFSQFYTVFFFGLICFVVGAAYFTIKYSPIPADPMGITLVEVAQAEGVEQSIPILDKIAECESGNMHFDPKTGQVLTVGNTNKTVDIGRYQVNEHYWGTKATELGLDLFDEEDNETMAKWILANHGTEPWVHSKGCWN